MIIADIMCKTVEFINTKLETQCNKCKKFKYTANTCNTFTKCQFCVNVHITHDYKCDICKLNQVCSHIDLKCANYDKKHHEKNALCEVYLALKSNTRNIDKLNLLYIKFVKFRNAKEFRSIITIDKQISCKQYLNTESKMQILCYYKYRELKIIMFQFHILYLRKLHLTTIMKQISKYAS